MRRFLLFVIILAFVSLFSSKVRAQNITVSSAAGSISACAGLASTDFEQFTVSGSGLSGSVTATAPAGFQVSLSPNSGFANSVVITPSGGSLNATVVYVRSAASAAPGSPTGNVTLSSPGATAQTVAVKATIYASPTMSAVTNQILSNGSYTVPINFNGTANTYTWVNSLPSIGLPANGTGNIASFIATNTGNAPVTASITVSPVSATYAYVINYGGNDILVLNAITGATVATIPVGVGPETIFRSQDGSKVYVANTSANTVSIISTASNTVIATLNVGTFPRGMAESPDGKYIYVDNPGLNGTPASISVISTATDNIVTTIPVSQPAYAIVVSPDGSKLYLANSTSQTVSVINATTYAQIANIPIGGYATAIAMSPDGNYLYVVDKTNNRLVVINTGNNSIAANIPVGLTPTSVTISPGGDKVYVTNSGDNTISVVNTQSNSVSATFQDETQPYASSLNADGSLLYVTNYDVVSIINTTTNAIQTTLTPNNVKYFYPVGVVVEGGGCDGIPSTFTITVNPTSSTAKITASVASGNITSCAGTPSANPHVQQFTVSATGLTAALTATAPAGFEVSLNSGSGYGNSVVLNQSGGNVNSTTIYVRSSASAPVGIQSANVALSSSGTTSQYVLVTATVVATPAVNTVPNQTVNNGNQTTAVNFTGAANAYNWTNDTPGIGLPATGSGNIAPFTAVNTGSAPITATVTVTPVSLAYAYISNGQSNTVSAIDIKTNQVAATIPVGNNPFGVAVSPDYGRVYVANTGSNNISVISTLTNTVISTIDVGQTSPATITVSPDGARLYVTDNSSYNIIAVNTATNTVIATFTAGARPYGIAVSPNGQTIYVANSFSGTVSVISSSSYAVINTITITAGSGPLGLAMSADGSRLYVVNSISNTISVINTATNLIIATIPVQGNPQGISLSPDGGTAYVANGSGANNTVSVINTSTNAVTANIPVGTNPMGISVSPDGASVFVVNSGSNSVSVISTASNTVIATVPVGNQPLSFGNFTTAATACAGVPTKFTITVNPTPKPAIVAGQVSGNISACDGTASASPNIVQFTVSGTNLTGDIVATAPQGFEVSLSTNSGYSGNVTLAASDGSVSNITVYIRSAASAPSGSLSGNVVLTSAGAANQSVAVTGTVNQQVSPTVSIAILANAVCAGQQTTFTATPVNGGSSPVYQWLINGNQTGTNSATFTATTLSTGDVVSCVMTSNAACVVPANATSNSININILPLVTPSLSITASANNVCSGSAVTFNATQVNGGSAPDYQWLVNGNNAGTNSPVFTSSALSNGDVVSCIMTSNAACAAPVNITSNGITMTITPSPTVNAGGNKTIDKAGSVTLNAVATGGIIDVTWNPATGLSSDKILDPVASPASTTTYTVLVQTANGCSAMDNVTVYVQSAVVIPNAFTPNGDGINDKWDIKNLDSYPNCTVQIFTRAGQNVYSSIGYGNPWDGTYKGSELPGGTYYYIVNLKNGSGPLSGFVVIIR